MEELWLSLPGSLRDWPFTHEVGHMAGGGGYDDKKQRFSTYQSLPTRNLPNFKSDPVLKLPSGRWPGQKNPYPISGNGLFVAFPHVRLQHCYKIPKSVVLEFLTGEVTAPQHCKHYRDL